MSHSMPLGERLPRKPSPGSIGFKCLVLSEGGPPIEANTAVLMSSPFFSQKIKSLYSEDGSLVTLSIPTGKLYEEALELVEKSYEQVSRLLYKTTTTREDVEKKGRFKCRKKGCDFFDYCNQKRLDHESDEHGMSRHVCDKCDGHFDKLSELKDHEGKKHYPCPIKECGKTLRSKRTLKVHLQGHEKLKKDAAKFNANMQQFQAQRQSP